MNAESVIWCCVDFEHAFFHYNLLGKMNYCPCCGCVISDELHTFLVWFTNEAKKSKKEGNHE